MSYVPTAVSRLISRLAFSLTAFEAIVETLPLGSVGYEPALNAKGESFAPSRVVGARVAEAWRPSGSAGSPFGRRRTRSVSLSRPLSAAAWMR